MYTQICDANIFLGYLNPCFIVPFGGKNQPYRAVSLQLSGFCLLSTECLIQPAEKCINTILIRKLAENMQLTLIAWRRRRRRRSASCYCCRTETGLAVLANGNSDGGGTQGTHAISRRCDNNWLHASVLGTLVVFAISSLAPHQHPFSWHSKSLPLCLWLSTRIPGSLDPRIRMGDPGLGHGGAVPVGLRCLLRQMPL